MDLVLLVLVVALIGFLVYIITTKVPMPAGWATTIQVLALVVVVVWLLSHFVMVPNVLPRR
jgi:alpha-D-ribose 1-methylphosphonate 5-phosphate C-P lyase